MRVEGVHYRSIWPLGSDCVRIIDQTRLPFELVTRELRSLEDAVLAIRDMWVRGAPLIGATAAWGLALALHADPSDAALGAARAALIASRPTAVNLRWALDVLGRELVPLRPPLRAAAAWAAAQRLTEQEVETCRAIGEHGLPLLERLAGARERPLQVLTHCNAGWLACVDWGTALAPIYLAHDAGIALHVWVDETRPRNQGAALTAFELAAHGVPHTVIADNLGGHLMQRGQVDLVIVGSDRVSARGDVCNKIGTYLKALAACDNGVPFYAALPMSTVDLTIAHGREIPIEERSPGELTHIEGLDVDGRRARVRVVPGGSPALNLAFDVTPAELVTGLITERGICAATAPALQALAGAA